MFVWTSGFHTPLVHTDFNMFVDMWTSANESPDPTGMHSCFTNVQLATYSIFTGHNEVVAKVIILHLSVILFTGGGMSEADTSWVRTPRSDTPRSDTPVGLSTSPWD